MALIVDEPEKAKKALHAQGMRYTEQPVLHVELPNTPEVLASFLRKLAAKDINITARV